MPAAQFRQGRALRERFPHRRVAIDDENNRLF
jgi:hypothetical protein